jgi:hypothetical protein
LSHPCACMLFYVCLRLRHLKHVTASTMFTALHKHTHADTHMHEHIHTHTCTNTYTHMHEHTHTHHCLSSARSRHEADERRAVCHAQRHGSRVSVCVYVCVCVCVCVCACVSVYGSRVRPFPHHTQHSTTQCYTILRVLCSVLFCLILSCPVLFCTILYGLTLSCLLQICVVLRSTEECYSILGMCHCMCARVTLQRTISTRRRWGTSRMTSRRATTR